MGLTFRSQTAKNLTASRRKSELFPINHKKNRLVHKLLLKRLTNDLFQILEGFC